MQQSAQPSHQEGPTADDFVVALFAAAPLGSRVEVRPVPGMRPYLLDPADPRAVAVVGPQTKVNWHFGVTARDDQGEPSFGTMVWCDVDKLEDGYEPTFWPEPTARVSSGKGRHAYWALTEAVEPAATSRLAGLARLAFGGDVKVLDVTRGMRLPGTYNHKYKPPRLCELTSLSPLFAYTAADVEERLLAAVLAKYWPEGGEGGHDFSLAVGGLMSRTSWPRERLTRLVNHACRLAGDEKVANRVQSVVESITRAEAGVQVSVAGLREAMGDEYKSLVAALGLAARDGDLVYNGVRVGGVWNLERDCIEYLSKSLPGAFADGKPARWNGHHWEHVESSVVLADTFDFLAKLKVVQDGAEVDYQLKARTVKDVHTVLMGKMGLRVVPRQADSLFAVENGVLNLDTFELLPHAPELGSRWLAPVEYVPEADCPRWSRFLGEVLPDNGVAAFLQEWVGYCLRPGNRWQTLLWLYGESETGKSTFIKTVSELFGSGAHVAIRLGKLSDYTKAALASARLATCTEVGRKTIPTELIKEIVGEDAFEARHIFGTPFTTLYRGKVMVASNSLPAVTEGEGFWRRLKLVHFGRKVASRDVGINDALRAEAPGILNWALEGMRRVDGYTVTNAWPTPDAVQVMVKEYQDSADPFVEFASEELELGPELVTPRRELYARYSAWAKDHGYDPLPDGPVFRFELKRLGVTPEPNQRRVDGELVRVWRGAGLRNERF